MQYYMAPRRYCSVALERVMRRGEVRDVEHFDAFVEALNARCRI